MSTIYHADFTCSACGATVSVRVADSLNANRLPEAREWVLARTLFQAPCPCGRTMTALHPFLYADFERGLWVQVQPEAQRPGFWAREPEVLAAYRAAFDPASGPRFIGALGALVTPRLVFGYEELREKVVGADAGLDDALVEALKLEVLAIHPELMGLGVRLLTLDAVDGDQLRFRAYHFAPDAPGRMLGEIAVPRAAYDQLVARRPTIRGAYAGLFDGLYVNVQRYRFEPGAPASAPAAGAVT